MRIISSFWAIRLVGKGCLAFLDYLEDASVGFSSIELVLVVFEFQDIFPSDLPEIPLDRDIYFCIYLELGTLPISNPPYRIVQQSSESSKPIAGTT